MVIIRVSVSSSRCVLSSTPTKAASWCSVDAGSASMSSNLVRVRIRVRVAR